MKQLKIKPTPKKNFITDENIKNLTNIKDQSITGDIIHTAIQPNCVEMKSDVPFISYPGKWPEILNDQIRLYLLENTPKQLKSFDFPKDKTNRKFSAKYYIKKLQNG